MTKMSNDEKNKIFEPSKAYLPWALIVNKFLNFLLENEVERYINNWELLKLEKKKNQWRLQGGQVCAEKFSSQKSSCSSKSLECPI